MSGKYILDANKNAVEVDDVQVWGRWFETAKRKVAWTETLNGDVSTVFLGLDLSFGLGPPQLFETMVFGGSLDGEQDRYTTWAEAEAGHAVMVNRAVTAGQKI